MIERNWPAARELMQPPAQRRRYQCAHHEDQEVHRTRGAAFRIIWVHANVPSDAGANFLFKDNGSTRMVCLFISLVLRFASVSLAAYSYRIPGAVSSFPISSVRTELWLVAH